MGYLSVKYEELWDGGGGGEGRFLSETEGKSPVEGLLGPKPAPDTPIVEQAVRAVRTEAATHTYSRLPSLSSGTFKALIHDEVVVVLSGAPWMPLNRSIREAL
ncbi:hypothetical protein E2C01_007792 [Portunus trituberculatus]|uniref:Uncharacterized protein n=1 Tax=Portunus trituberculatus TaxID=210409 RepID=A0A5B7CZX7_PORTR|nr:hypothetical protein [Portunus trituberculatus]